MNTLRKGISSVSQYGKMPLTGGTYECINILYSNLFCDSDDSISGQNLSNYTIILFV